MLSLDLELRALLRELRLEDVVSLSEGTRLDETRLPLVLRLGTGVGSPSSSSSPLSPSSSLDGVGVMLPDSSSSDVSSTTKLFRGAERREDRDCAVDDIVTVFI